jgi:hypothetical protein
VSRDRLPPLGKDLFRALEADPTMVTWRQLPERLRDLFRTGPFEIVMQRTLEDDEARVPQLRRDLELSLYFSRFTPATSNLYTRLARHISRASWAGWNGAIVTLNYERLLEESLLHARVFPVVRGVDFYDDHLPLIGDKQTIEICYPHGACHFFLGAKHFDLSLGGNVTFSPKGISRGGVNHLLVRGQIEEAIRQYLIPLICRYEPIKSPAVMHNFFEIQHERYRQMVAAARSIAIVGVYCAHLTDRHLWEPLGQTQAELFYFAPFTDSAEIFRAWAAVVGKREGAEFVVVPTSFRDGFERLLAVAALRPRSANGPTALRESAAPMKVRRSYFRRFLGANVPPTYPAIRCVWSGPGSNR